MDQKPEHQATKQAATKQPRKTRCECGGCGICSSNESWDRKFEEKHGKAAMEYYRAPLLRVSSSSWQSLKEVQFYEGALPKNGSVRLKQKAHLS